MQVESIVDISLPRFKSSNANLEIQTAKDENKAVSDAFGQFILHHKHLRTGKHGINRM